MREGSTEMRTLAVSTFLTLDGVMQAPGGPEEDPTGGFTHGGWSVNYWDDHMGEVMGEALSRPFDLLLGRKTYEIFAAHWPHASDEAGGAVLNNARKYVASRTLDAVEWQNSTLLEGDVAEAVARLKEDDGPEIQRGLKLADSETSTTGVLMTTYERAGEVEYGSFALEEPTQAELDRREQLRKG